MSRSILYCPTCKSAIAVKHHSGRIQVCADVRMVILTSGEVELRCGCGAKRVVNDGKCGQYDAISVLDKP